MSATGSIVGATSVPMLERWVRRMVPEFQRRGEVMAEGAARTSGIDAESAVARAPLGECTATGSADPRCCHSNERQ